MQPDLLKISQCLIGGILLCLLLWGCGRNDIGNASGQIEIAAPAEILPQDILMPYHVRSGCGLNETEQAYRIGPEDTLEIRVFGESELSGRYTVSDTGSISMPLAGDIGVSGCTVSEATENIVTKFKDGYLVDPSITVEVQSYRPFYIIGEVRTPGRYDYAAGMNVLKSVALAGGFTYRANRKNVEIYRNDLTGQKKYQQKMIEADIQPGDIIVIKERFF